MGIQGELRSGMKLRTDPEHRLEPRARSSAASLSFQRVHAADSLDRDNGEHDDHGHLDHELKQIGDEHAPQAGESRDEGGARDQAEDDRKRLERE